MRPERLVKRMLAGNVANIEFEDLHRLLVRLGFERTRTSGSHQIYKHPEVVQHVAVQNHKGQAKPYQVRQVVAVIRQYDLRLDGRSD